MNEILRVANLFEAIFRIQVICKFNVIVTLPCAVLSYN